jgi:hypothetical protein
MIWRTMATEAALFVAMIAVLFFDAWVITQSYQGILQAFGR